VEFNLPRKTEVESKRKVQAFETEKELEDKVATWLTKQGYTCKKRILARGKSVARPHEVDIYATKGMFFKHHLWVGCKADKVNRTFIQELVEDARDVKEMYDESEKVQAWAPNMLMLVSDAGFDSDALKLADKYKIYCVHANETFEFIGKMKRGDMEDGDTSDFD
jgi:hypothetical protein